MIAEFLRQRSYLHESRRRKFKKSCQPSHIVADADSRLDDPFRLKERDEGRSVAYLEQLDDHDFPISGELEKRGIVELAFFETGFGFYVETDHGLFKQTGDRPPESLLGVDDGYGAVEPGRT